MLLPCDLQARAAAEDSSEDRMKFLFSLFDQDGDGDISMEEFTKKMKEVCTTLTDSELQAVCRDCDQVGISSCLFSISVAFAAA